MGTVTEIGNPEKIFTVEEANDMLPLIKQICALYENKITKLLSNHNWYVISGAPEQRTKDCDSEMHAQLMKLGTKLTKLGIKVMGDYYMGFYAGSSFYWSYRYPEERIEFWHGLMENPRVSRHRLEYLKALK
jgi:hypothetical protein